MDITPELVDRMLLLLFADLGATRHPVDLRVVEASWPETGLRHTDLFAALRRLQREGDLSIEPFEGDRFLTLTPQGRVRVGRRLPFAVWISRYRRHRFRMGRLAEQKASHPDYRRRRTDVSAAS